MPPDEAADSRYRPIGTFSTKDRTPAAAEQAERHAAEAADGAAGEPDRTVAKGIGWKVAGGCPLTGGRIQGGDRKAAARESFRFGPQSHESDWRALQHPYINALTCI